MVLIMIYLMNCITQIIVSGTKPVVSLYVSKLGATPWEIGIIVSVFSLLPALLAIHIGKWIDRYGIRTLVLIGCAGVLVSLALPIVIPHVATFVVSQALMGLGFTCIIISIQKRIGNEKGDMDKKIATSSLYVALGATIGPTVGALLYDHYGFRVSYGMNIILVCMSIAFVLAMGKKRWEAGTEKGIAASGSKPSPNKAAGGNVWTMLRHRDLRNAVIVSGLMISNKEIFSAYFPLLGEKMGLSVTVIGLLLSVMGAAQLVIRLFQTYMVRALGRGTVLTWALYISGIVYIMTPVMPVVPLLLLLIIVLGAGLGVGQPLSLSYTLQVSPEERRGEVLGLRITFNRVSQFAIPLLFGGIGGAAGITAIFWASGLLLCVGGVITRSKAASTEQSNATFIP